MKASQAAAEVRSADAPRRLPQRQVLTGDVYESIKALVMDHVIKPGARVKIDTLARELQVSQTPVREALARLEADGLVVKEPLRGYSTTPLLNAAQLIDLFDFRLLVESWAARRAAERMDTHSGARLTQELARCPKDTAGNDYEHYQQLTAHDSRFHSLIAELSGSEQVQGALERTHCHLHLFRLYFVGSIGTKAGQEHGRIHRAIKSGDSDRAAAAMTAHLTASRDRLLRVLEHGSP